MNAPFDIFKSRRDDEARSWFVRLLENHPSEAELAQWEAWLDRDAKNRSAYERVARAWDLAGAVSIHRPSAVELAAGAARPGSGRPANAGLRRFGPALVWVGAAAAVAVAVLAALQLGDLLGRKGDRLVTERAQNLQTTFSDGSKISLSALSGVKVKYSRHTRLVRFERGEAMFEVAHDKARPFVVATDLGRVTAVGTAFVVGAHNGGLMIQVTEGVVKIRPGFVGADGGDAGASSELELRSGERMTLRQNGAAILVEKTFGRAAPAWKDGRLEYRAERLSDVVDDVNRYAVSQIVLGDAATGDLLYTGTVQVASIDSWAEGLAGAFPVTVEQRGGVVRVQEKK